MTLQSFFIFGNLIFGGGDYINARPAKLYFGFILFDNRHFLGMVCDMQVSYCQNSNFKFRPRQRTFFWIMIVANTFYTKSQNQDLSTAAAEIWIWIPNLDFARYQYLSIPKLKIQDSTEAATALWILLATNMFEYQHSKLNRPSFELCLLLATKYQYIYIFIPKSKIPKSAVPAAEIWISNFANYHCYYYQHSKFRCGSGRHLKFALC